jgi:hypothetical protein
MDLIFLSAEAAGLCDPLLAGGRDGLGSSGFRIKKADSSGKARKFSLGFFEPGFGSDLKITFSNKFRQIRIFGQ